ncbi:MAG: glycosyltransferase family 4 protein, partial [Clostridia bacterium]|nr:glycosyltransferase family 4 protein [Clostridia bacterium]
MRKILQVSSDSNIGGAGKCILTFCKYYDRERFAVSVVLPENSLLKPELQKLKIPVIEVPYLAEQSLNKKAIGVLRQVFREEKPDLVHTHASMSARIAAKALGIPVVYTRHSVFPPSKKLTSFPGKQINGFINSLTADRIIAVAEAAKANLTDTGVPERKITVLLNGVEPLTPCDAETLRAWRERYGIAPDDKVAVMAARLTEVKGQKYFIEAAKRLLDQGIRAKFLIGGTGDTYDALQEQIQELGVAGSVKLLGFVEDVAPLMTLADVQVNCSFGTEATSLALLEGMSLGKPIVATDFGGNPGVVQDGVNGFLTPTHDPEALAEGLKELFCNGALYQTMAENAKRIYQEKFTAEVYAKGIGDLYEETIQRKGGKKDESEV